MKEKLGDIKLDQTLTNVVIPTFDIKRLQPTVFSTYEVDHLHPCNVDSHQIILYHILQFLMFFFFFFQVKKNPSINALLSDICIATSAAPTYLPAHRFETKDATGSTLREFDLIDGGMAANNPV